MPPRKRSRVGRRCRRARARWMECMRTVGSLLAAMLLAWPAAAQQPPDVRKYVLTLEIPDTGNAIKALATVDFVRRAGSDTLVLNLVGMTVDKVVQYRSEEHTSELQS